MTNDLNLLIPELDNSTIRRNAKGQCSVFDLIRVVGGRKNPRQVWNDLMKQFPEVVQKTDNFKFPGRGQRKTPVTDREGWAYILGLLPGVMGQKYRESAAKLVTQYLDADIELAIDVVNRNESQEDLERLEARARSKVARKSFCSMLKRQGVHGRGYGRCTDSTYTGLFGTNAQGLRKRKGLNPKANVREHMSISELNTTAFTEDLEESRIQRINAQGNDQCADECLSVAQKVAQLKLDIIGA